MSGSSEKWSPTRWSCPGRPQTFLMRVYQLTGWYLVRTDCSTPLASASRWGSGKKRRSSDHSFGSYTLGSFRPALRRRASGSDVSSAALYPEGGCGIKAAYLSTHRTCG